MKLKKLIIISLILVFSMTFWGQALAKKEESNNRAGYEKIENVGYTVYTTSDEKLIEKTYKDIVEKGNNKKADVNGTAINYTTMDSEWLWFQYSSWFNYSGGQMGDIARVQLHHVAPWYLYQEDFSAYGEVEALWYKGTSTINPSKIKIQPNQKITATEQVLEVSYPPGMTPTTNNTSTTFSWPSDTQYTTDFIYDWDQWSVKIDSGDFTDYLTSDYATFTFPGYTKGLLNQVAVTID